MHQITMVSLEDLVKARSSVQKILRRYLILAWLAETLKSVESRANYKEYGLERLLKCLLLAVHGKSFRPRVREVFSRKYCSEMLL